MFPVKNSECIAALSSSNVEKGEKGTSRENVSFLVHCPVIRYL